MKKYIIAVNRNTLSTGYALEKFFVESFNTNSNWTQVTDPKENVDFMYNILRKEFYDTKSEIGNVFHPSHLKFLTNKYNLWNVMKKYTPKTYDKFFVKHYEVDIYAPQKNKNLFVDKKIFILRPSWGFARMGITLYDNYEDFEKFIKTEGIKRYNEAYSKKNKNDYNKNDTYKYVLSEYMPNQLIFKNRIINFRVLFMLTYVNNTYRGYLLKPIIIHTSSKERNNMTITDTKDIDSLITATNDNAKDYFFDDLTAEYGKKTTDFIFSQIKHVISQFMKIIHHTKAMKNYDNYKNTYDLFGIDAIIDSQFNVKFVEFNDKVGIQNYSDLIYQTIIGSIMLGTINKLYDYKYHIAISEEARKNIIRIYRNKKYLNSEISQKKYYNIVKTNNKSAHIPPKFFDEIFEKNKNWEKATKNQTDFLYTGGSKDYFKTKNIIANNFSDTHTKYLTNKSNLFHTVKKYLPTIYEKYMVFHTDVDITNLDQYEKLFDGRTYILRPTWGYARQGITIYDNFIKFKNYMLSDGKKQLSRVKNGNVYVLSEYVKDQLLFNNKNFNFRVFYLVSLVGNKYRSYMIKPIVIHTAITEKTNSIDLKSAISSSESNIDHFMRELTEQIGEEKTLQIEMQIQEIIENLFGLIKKYKMLENYDNTQNTYELFGLDFIADEKLSVKLIEFNYKIGVNDYADEVYEIICSAFINSTINKLYDDKYKIEINNTIKKNIIRIHAKI